MAAERAAVHIAIYQLQRTTRGELGKLNMYPYTIQHSTVLSSSRDLARSEMLVFRSPTLIEPTETVILDLGETLTSPLGEKGSSAGKTSFVA